MDRTHAHNLPRTVDEAVLWYKDEKATYGLLAEKVKSILTDVLESEKVAYNKIEARAKDFESFKNKWLKNSPSDPKDIQDLAGIRIIVYVNSDLEKVYDIVCKLFPTEQHRVKNKSETLGIDRVGYRSKHFVAALPPERTRLAEFKKFERMLFEIQARTILQHAWAEVNHDRNYKFSGILPKEIQRRFNLLSGTLEIIDNEFERLSNDVEVYSKDVTARTKTGKLDISINSTSLGQYLRERFGVIPRMQELVHPDVIEELYSMGIKSLADFDKIIPPNTKEVLIKIINSHNQFKPSYTALIRLVLAVHNIDEYYRKAWKEHFSEVNESYVDFLREFRIEADTVKKYIKVT